MFKMRETSAFAYCLGAYELLRFGDCAGRTHRFNQDWNEAYDRGMNLGESVSYCFSKRSRYVVLSALYWALLWVFSLSLFASLVLAVGSGELIYVLSMVLSALGCGVTAWMADLSEQLADDDAHYEVE